MKKLKTTNEEIEKLELRNWKSSNEQIEKSK